MSREKVVEKRAKKLAKMDRYLRDNIGDEEIFYPYWIDGGAQVPDEASEEDFESIAEDDEYYERCLSAFVDMCLLYDEE